jgi:hypothetical protein
VLSVSSQVHSRHARDAKRQAFHDPFGQNPHEDPVLTPSLSPLPQKLAAFAAVVPPVQTDPHHSPPSIRGCVLLVVSSWLS